MGKNVLKLTEFHGLVVLFYFLRYSFFPDFCASENASFIPDSAVSLVSMRYMPPSKRTDSESKLSKTVK